MDLETRIFDYIKTRKNVSFVELEQFDKERGENTITWPGQPNIVLWVNFSKNFCAALTELFEKKKIIIKATTQLTYLVDGCTLNLPLAKSVRKYKTRRWLPVVLDVHP